MGKIHIPTEKDLFCTAYYLEHLEQVLQKTPTTKFWNRLIEIAASMRIVLTYAREMRQLETPRPKIQNFKFVSLN